MDMGEQVGVPVEKGPVDSGAARDGGDRHGAAVAGQLMEDVEDSLAAPRGVVSAALSEAHLCSGRAS
jgi:hypothetical protein